MKRIAIALFVMTGILFDMPALASAAISTAT